MIRLALEMGGELSCRYQRLRVMSHVRAMLKACTGVLRGSNLRRVKTSCLRGAVKSTQKHKISHCKDIRSQYNRIQLLASESNF